MQSILSGSAVARQSKDTVAVAAFAKCCSLLMQTASGLGSALDAARASTASHDSHPDNRFPPCNNRSCSCQATASFYHSCSSPSSHCETSYNSSSHSQTSSSSSCSINPSKVGSPLYGSHTYVGDHSHSSGFHSSRSTCCTPGSSNYSHSVLPRFTHNSTENSAASKSVHVHGSPSSSDGVDSLRSSGHNTMARGSCFQAIHSVNNGTNSKTRHGTSNNSILNANGSSLSTCHQSNHKMYSTAMQHSSQDEALPASDAGKPDGDAHHLDQRRIHNAKVLMVNIKRGKTPKDLAKIINNKSDQLDYMHLTAAVAHLRQLLSHEGMHDEFGMACKQVLRSVMRLLLQPQHLHSCDPRGVMNVLHSLAIMEVADHEYVQGLVDELGRDDYRKLKEANADKLGTIVWAVGKLTDMGYQAPKQFWKNIGDIMFDVCSREPVKSAILANALSGFALARYYHPKFLAHAEHAIASKRCLDHGEPQHWSTTLLAFSQLNFPLQQSTLRLYAQKVVGGCLKPRAVQSWSDALAAFAHYKYLDHGICNTCSRVIIKQVGHNVQPWQAASVLHSWAVLYCPEPAAWLLDFLVKPNQSENLSVLISKMAPNDVCHMLWALSVLQLLGKYPRLVQLLVDRVNDELVVRDVPRQWKAQLAQVHWAMQYDLPHDRTDTATAATAVVENSQPAHDVIAVGSSLAHKNHVDMLDRDTASGALLVPGASKDHSVSMLHPALVQEGLKVLRAEAGPPSTIQLDIAAQLKKLQERGVCGVRAVHVSYPFPNHADVLVDLDGHRKIVIVARSAHQCMVNAPGHLDGRTRLRERLLARVFGAGNIVCVDASWNVRDGDEAKQATLARLLGTQ